jgi:hypothetical protein
MTFSDEDTTIHHRNNVCVNHPDREARHLCVECGQWFCGECMSATHKYLCDRCAKEAVRETASTATQDKFARAHNRQTERRSGRLHIPLLFGGFFALALMLARHSIGLVVLPVAFFFLVKSVFGGRRDVFSPKRGTPPRKIVPGKKNENITGEQLAALFRVSGGRVTAEKLARAADVSAKAAKKFLDRQVIEGTLDVEAGDSELIYLKK